MPYHNKNYDNENEDNEMQQEEEPKKKGKKKVKFNFEKKEKKTMNGKAYYANMSASALKKLLMEKKTSLLTKSGFPDGKIPRGKEAMINLCIKLKRKRW